jgi:hypothetical protein
MWGCGDVGRWGSEEVPRSKARPATRSGLGTRRCSTLPAASASRSSATNGEAAAAPAWSPEEEEEEGAPPA